MADKVELLDYLASRAEGNLSEMVASRVEYLRNVIGSTGGHPSTEAFLASAGTAHENALLVKIDAGKAEGQDWNDELNCLELIREATRVGGFDPPDLHPNTANLVE